jgi:hypothetical protein
LKCLISLVFCNFSLSDSNGQTGLKLRGKVYCTVLHLGEGPGADCTLFSGATVELERGLIDIFGMRASFRSSWCWAVSWTGRFQERWHLAEFTITPRGLTISLRIMAGINSTPAGPVVYD